MFQHASQAMATTMRLTAPEPIEIMEIAVILRLPCLFYETIYRRHIKKQIIIDIRRTTSYIASSAYRPSALVF